MSIRSVPADEVLTRLGDFDAVIDARSPSEFAHDHLPGAVNWPSLDDAQRHAVGTLYSQVSTFDARKLGAVLVARNIATHIEREAPSLSRQWQPLLYCWRGGQRSGALALVLGQIGFRVTVLEGGYKAFREQVRLALEQQPGQFTWHVLCGKTGSGKTRLLHALAAQGAQVLDLEHLAAHRGSVLGGLPGRPQPSQKAFETMLWQHLRGFDPARPVFVESESARVGQLRVPPALLACMRAGVCMQIEMPLAARVALLLEDYPEHVRDVESFCERLALLTTLCGKAQVAQWQAAARAGRFDEVVQELLATHYDPVYQRSMRGHFPGLEKARTFTVADASPRELLQAVSAMTRVGEKA